MPGPLMFGVLICSFMQLVQARPSRVTAVTRVPLPNVQLAPDLLTAWIDAANAIVEDPPYLTTYAASATFPPRPCAAGTAKAGLTRACFNEDAVTPADARLAKFASPANRLALLKHYVQKYALPGFTEIDKYTTNWLVQRSAPGRLGASDVNGQIGMIRYQLFLEEQEVVESGRAQMRRGEAAHLNEGFAAAVRQSTVATAEVFRRQRRLLDFWFPDGPVWTAILTAACAEDEVRQQLPLERCCFLKKGECLNVVKRGPRVPASTGRPRRAKRTR